jgi:hypothetical protein
LRAIHCPEATVKDILTAEIDRRYHTEEDRLRPKPADHVPFGWSAATSEPKILERRQRAATLAQEEAALLHEALGYAVPVAPPTYALTTSEQEFETSLATLPADKQEAARQVDEDYWTKVRVLQDRTKGFWQTADVTELQQFKQQRQESLRGLGLVK